jgi:signal transduction histidine kinase
MNAAWEKLTGIPRKTACGKMSRELGLPKTFVRLQEHSARQVLKSRGGVSFDFSYPLQAGPVDYEVRLIPEFEGSSISSILLIGRDITEQKRLQTLAASNEHDIRALSASLLSAQEQERRRVAREIHDSLCQHLGALAAEIAGLAAGFPESSQARKRLQAARERALRTAEEASQIARQLHPAILEDLGLPKALQNLCGEFSRREGIPIKLRMISLFPETPLEAASCVYRVAQEALHNVAKHAQAKHVRVRLSGTGRLHLSIQDDGKGFEPDAVRGNGGLGLVSMQERARMAGAKLAIQGRPNRGTLVDLIVPNRGATLEQATATAGR